jgi:hypothetical protein
MKRAALSSEFKPVKPIVFLSSFKQPTRVQSASSRDPNVLQNMKHLYFSILLVCSGVVQAQSGTVAEPSGLVLRVDSVRMVPESKTCLEMEPGRIVDGGPQLLVYSRLVNESNVPVVVSPRRHTVFLDYSWKKKDFTEQDSSPLPCEIMATTYRLMPGASLTLKNEFYPVKTAGIVLRKPEDFRPWMEKRLRSVQLMYTDGFHQITAEKSEWLVVE